MKIFNKLLSIFKNKKIENDHLKELFELMKEDVKKENEMFDFIKSKSCDFTSKIIYVTEDELCLLLRNMKLIRLNDGRNFMYGIEIRTKTPAQLIMDVFNGK